MISKPQQQLSINDFKNPNIAFLSHTDLRDMKKRFQLENQEETLAIKKKKQHEWVNWIQKQRDIKNKQRYDKFSE